MIGRGFYTGVLPPREGLLLHRVREETGIVVGDEATHSDVQTLLTWVTDQVKVGEPGRTIASPADLFDGGEAPEWQIRQTFSWLCLEGFGIPVLTRALRHTDDHARLDVTLVGVRQWVVDPATGLFPTSPKGEPLSLEEAQADPQWVVCDGSWAGLDGRGVEGFFRAGSDFFSVDRTVIPKSDAPWVDADTP
jgi:hypothetical protein